MSLTKMEARVSAMQGADVGSPIAYDVEAGARLVFEALVTARNRLADLSPLTSQDFEDVSQAMHEVVLYLLTPPRGTKSDVALTEVAKRDLDEASRNRTIDLYATTIALVARKLVDRRRRGALKVDQLSIVGEALDGLTFDYASPKKQTLATLRELRADLDARIAYVSAYRSSGYRFQERPELYANRADKTEGPDRFFGRVYGDHARRGLRQADVRRIDPAYYNVLHVWCTRHRRKLSSFLAPSRRSTVR